MTVTALIVAAGKGERAGGGVPKQYRTLAGVPVLRRAILAFLRHPRIDAVRVMIAEEHVSQYEAAVAGLELGAPVIGGAERQASVLNGLESLAAETATGAPDHVLIHDAARPLVPVAVIDRVLDALETGPASLPVLPVTDTLRRGQDGLAAGTVSRDGLWRAQTPQGMRFAPVLEAHRRAASEGVAVTDDAALMEWAGHAVTLVTGSEDAMKITTAEDFALAERLLAGALETRVGTGFDVHRLGDKTQGGVDGVALGGIVIPHDKALLGHSDADVGLHAITDALLGALGDGDIGAHFPPSDPQWKGAASHMFLADACRRVREAGGQIRHLDLTVICERPKVGPHRESMRARIAEICGVPVARVSVKATTTERLGFPGRGEGIAAQAAATIALPAPDAL
ncbi:bifunctional 2-C-methyl-D-erythritol 4-phosphate cytidylyltransferase/2-C-methyl-D-erythritol 2,4-cyclodiphosphate synthase [Thalassobaculum sp.]|uniref:bifunctional 2-C-methyl-D-erythritol 4-phosphate cytidylyltransferase/2-C-methyl-D-erythritol 2,4-cyclodiphosphate synthase n=1 Tax=Thalassobaculum sp. TaxID=2022740 RepID=UPI003B5C954A